MTTQLVLMIIGSLNPLTSNQIQNFIYIAILPGRKSLRTAKLNSNPLVKFAFYPIRIGFQVVTKVLRHGNALKRHIDLIADCLYRKGLITVIMKEDDFFRPCSSDIICLFLQELFRNPLTHMHVSELSLIIPACNYSQILEELAFEEMRYEIREATGVESRHAQLSRFGRHGWGTYWCLPGPWPIS